MKDRWLKLWRSRPRLGGGWRTVRNLVVVLVCLYGLWAWADYPLPTAKMEFRRLERQNLLPPSEIQGVFQGIYQNRMTVYGVLEDQVVMGHHRAGFGYLEYWPREETGPALFPAAEHFPSSDELLIAAADVPAGTASARLDMSLDCWFTQQGASTSISALEGGYPRDDSRNWTRWARDYQTEGELLREGGVLFRVPRGDEDGAVSIEQELFFMLTRQSNYRQSAKLRGGNFHMEAVFYGQDGRELGRAALSSPEE